MISQKLASATTGAPFSILRVTTPGTTSWIVPPGTTSVSILCVGSGGSGESGNVLDPDRGGGGGGGGALAYTNNIPVTPGETLTIFVGSNSGASYVRRGTTDLVRAAGGSDGGEPTGGSGGTVSSSVGSVIFRGGSGSSGSSTSALGGGGGGVAKPSGNGVTGVTATTVGRGGGRGQYITFTDTSWSVTAASAQSSTDNGVDATSVMYGAGGGGAVRTANGAYGIGGDGGWGVVVILGQGRTFSSSGTF